MTADNQYPINNKTEVHIGGLDVETEYERHIEELNQRTLSAVKAAEYLGGLLLQTPESWDRVVRRGELEDSDHELRALIAIARGDPRPMGVIYDEIRRMVKDVVDQTDLHKTAEVARRYDPLGDRKRHYF